MKRKRRDRAGSIAYNSAAPRDERLDAQTELQKATMPRALSDLIPAPDIQPIIDYIQLDLEEQEIAKALRKDNVIPFPSRAAKNRKPGMQSVWLDDLQIHVNGDWYERPGAFTFDMMRAMVEQTPILNAVIMTRIRQVQRFCRPNESARGPGFKITTKHRDVELGETEKQSVLLLQDFFTHCGWETRPRRRMRLRRDDFASFMAKLVRDTLTMDSAPIETEYKRDRELGLDGLYAVDGATIRLCTEEGYRGDDEIYALQVVQGQIRAAYTYDDLIYVPRNPRTDVLTGGYGLSETELLIRVVTGFLNAFTYNTKYFDSNSIPKGLLHLTGNYSEQDLNAFKRYWNAMVKGINNAWTLPVLVSKDQESRAAFERFGVDVNEIMFAKWMTFLTSIICAIYGIAPDEINFESFTAGHSPLSGSDTEEKLANSKDKGLRPLLAYFENVFSDFIVAEFSDKYVFRWTGLDAEDEQREFETKKLVMTVNEMRAERGMEPIKAAWGEAPLNPSLLGAWQAEQQETNADYGQPEPEQQDDDEDEDEQRGGDFGQVDGDDVSGDFGAPESDDTDDVDETDWDNGPEMQKAFGLPVLSIEV